MRRKNDIDLLQTVLSLTDVFVEIYLKTIIQAFLELHETVYCRLSTLLRCVMDENKEKIPDWFTANFITYSRAVLVFPCLIFVARGHTILPCIIVVLVNFGGLLDGVAACYWIDVNKEQEGLALKEAVKPPASPVSNDDAFEIVTTGSPHSVLAWGVLHRHKSYGGVVDALSDHAFVVPCWILLLKTVPPSGYFHTIQFITLCCLIMAETCNACIQFRAYFTLGGVPSPKTEGFDFSTGAVKEHQIGKVKRVKQTFEMIGTAFYVMHPTRYIGLVLLMLALPLAYESVRRKLKKCFIYVNGDTKEFDHRILKFWMQAKGMGSKLIVGVPGSNKTDRILNACAVSYVDEIIAEAPDKVDLMFLEDRDIDYVVCSSTQAQFVTDEVLNAECCLVIDEAGVAKLLRGKTEHKD